MLGCRDKGIKKSDFVAMALQISRLNAKSKASLFCENHI